MGLELVKSHEMDPEMFASGLLDVAMHNSEWIHRSIKEFTYWVLQPAVMQQCVMLVEDGYAKGFMTWGFLTEEGASKLVEGRPLTHDQWCDGTHFWVVDFACNEGLGARFARLLMKQVFVKDMPVYWWRTKKGEIGSYRQQRVH